MNIWKTFHQNRHLDGFHISADIKVTWRSELTLLVSDGEINPNRLAQKRSSVREKKEEKKETSSESGVPKDEENPATFAVWRGPETVADRFCSVRPVPVRPLPCQGALHSMGKKRKSHIVVSTKVHNCCRYIIFARVILCWACFFFLFCFCFFFFSSTVSQCESLKPREWPSL